MNDPSYRSLSIDHLLSQYEKSCLIQYETDVSEGNDLYNKEYRKLVEIKKELQSRGIEARRNLLLLLQHENNQVRLMAAKHVYPVARGEATACLQNLAAGPFPDDQVFAARMTLHRLDEVPDCLDH